MSKKVKFKSLQVGNVTWFIFNVYGLKIKKSKNWMNFLFEDATIANTDEVVEYIEDIYNYGRDFTPMLKGSDSLIVVHVGGNIKQNNDKMAKIARERADEIISLLYFVFLYLTYYRNGITMDYELFSSSGGNFVYFSSQGQHAFHNQTTKGEHWIQLPKSPYIVSRLELMRLLKIKLFQNLTNIIISKRIAFYEIIRQSLVNYYRTNNTPSPITQFIGAITSIEILLKDNRTYEKIKDRIFVLLDENFYNRFIENDEDYIGVFRLRHDMVHEGKFCSGNDAFRAIRLASCIIIAFSNICNFFSSKDEICICFDSIFKYKKNIEKKYSKDIFKIIKTWNGIKFDFKELDLIILYLIYYYGLHNTELRDNEKLKLSNAIYTYSKIRKLSFVDSFNKINELIISSRRKFNNIMEFKSFYKKNNQEIQKAYSLFAKHQNLVDSGY